jgi:hypothetical protein
MFSDAAPGRGAAHHAGIGREVAVARDRGLDGIERGAYPLVDLAPSD